MFRPSPIVRARLPRWHFCWGDEFDTGSTTPTPTSVGGAANAILGTAGVGVRHVCILDINDKVLCLGFNESGQTGGPIPEYTGVLTEVVFP